MKRKDRWLALLLAALLAGTWLPAAPAYAASSAPAEESAQEEQAAGTVTGFGALDEDEISMTEKEPLEQLLAAMPETLEVFLDNGNEPTEIPVSWYCPSDYEASDDFYFQFSPTWDTVQYPLAEDIDVETDAPYIAVYIADPAAMGEVPASGTGTRAATSTNATAIYQYLTVEQGLNSAAACGVLANMYAESAMNPHAKCRDTNGKISYGLCQWNGSRYTRLKSWCAENGRDYTTISGQLGYLSYELGLKSYSDVLTYLQGVNNTASGAYDSAYYWCYYFEQPASRAKRSVERGNLAKNTYWPAYGSSALATENMTEPVLTAAAYPESTMEYGSYFTLRGTVSFQKALTKVSAGVYNQAGELVTGDSAQPNSTIFDLYALDETVLFSRVPVGSYTYRVAAEADGESFTLLEQPFTVTARSLEDAAIQLDAAAYTGEAVTPKPTVSYGSQTLTEGSDYTLRYENNTGVGTAVCILTGKGNYTGEVSKTFQILSERPVITDATAPDTLRQRQSFRLRGTIYSAKKMSRVTVGVYNSLGIRVTGKIARPNATVFNVAEVDNSVRFGSLPAGKYTYCITVKSGGRNRTVLRQSFTVTK